MGQSRILRIHPDGIYEDFVRGLEPELQSTVGMKVDAERRRLWVCTGRYTLFGGSQEGPPRTGVLLFDLDDGKLLKSWMVDQPGPAHIFNDLALASNGDVFATTTLLGRVYRISADSDEMTILLDTPDQQSNGITLSPDERFLFFTLDRTISRMELSTRELKALVVPDGADVGTDGLCFVEGALVAMKPRLKQVIRLPLNAALDAVDRVEVLMENDPGFDYPTTGVVVDDALVLVATSFADIPRNPNATEQHGDVLIYRLPLGG